MSDQPTAVLDGETTTTPITTELAALTDAVLDEVLVEEVSIDGMCGVY